MDDRTPVGQVPWRMMFQDWADDASLERRKLERRPRWWMVWTVAAAGAVPWLAVLVVG